MIYFLFAVIAQGRKECECEIGNGYGCGYRKSERESGSSSIVWIHQFLILCIEDGSFLIIRIISFGQFVE